MAILRTDVDAAMARYLARIKAVEGKTRTPALQQWIDEADKAHVDLSRAYREQEREAFWARVKAGKGALRENFPMAFNAGPEPRGPIDAKI